MEDKLPKVMIGALELFGPSVRRWSFESEKLPDAPLAQYYQINREQFLKFQAEFKIMGEFIGCVLGTGLEWSNLDILKWYMDNMKK
mgnify:CR=1 FL=1